MMKKWISLFGVAFVGGLFSMGVYHAFVTPVEVEVNNTPPTTRLVNLPVPNTANVSVDFTSAAEKSIDAVVHVWTERIESGYTHPFYQFFGEQPTQRRSLSSGSGVIVSNDGFIVTNNHVVKGAQNIKVKLNSGEVREAEVIGQDAATDLALLKIEGEQYPYLPYGNSDQVKVGQWVLAVGNPFNLTSTVTAGIVSAKARNINLLGYDAASGNVPLESFIQTDAAVNPGNSGGALVGVNGELVGINTAIASATGSYAGYSFAIPANIVKKVVKDLYEFGNVQRAFIGVQIRDLSEDLVDELELKDFNGAYVAGLTQNGAAESGGIEEGDVIVKVGQAFVNNSTQLQEKVGQYRPGDKIEVQLIRNGDVLTKTIELRNSEGTTALNTMPVGSNIKFLGASLSEVSKDELSRLNLKSGVKVDKLSGSVLQKSGMAEGFIITKIDKTPIQNAKQMQELIASKKGNGILIEGVYPDGARAYYGFGI